MSETVTTVALKGEWQVQGIGEQLAFLSSAVETVCAPSVRIDLSGVGAVDACGCQLLHLFLQTLKGRGITPLPCGIPAEIGARMAALGFADLAMQAGNDGEEAQ